MTCECGHPVNEHQTGEGAWTGFCYADASTPTDPTRQCKCEQPTPMGETVVSSYRVRWSIRVDAETEEQAVALGHKWLLEQLKEDAVNFEVVNKVTGQRTWVRVGQQVLDRIRERNGGHD